MSEHGWWIPFGSRYELRVQLFRTWMRCPVGAKGWAWRGLAGHVVQFDIRTDDFAHAFLLFPFMLIVYRCRAEGSLRASRWA